MEQCGSACPTMVNPTQEVLGQKIFDLAAELFPICRSITGDGVRQTLQMLRRHIDLSIHDVPTGTPVFDWSIPPEWNIRDAYIADEQGDRIVDFKTSNLHVLNYSAPVHTKLPLEELKRHIFTLPEQPDLIPYRTSYYVERWGFCMSQNQLDSLEPGIYEAVIDSTLSAGSLTYAEYVHRGDNRGRSAAVGTHLPPVTGQRQLLRPRTSDPSGPTAECKTDAPYVSLRLRTGNDWSDYLAREE